MLMAEVNIQHFRLLSQLNRGKVVRLSVRFHQRPVRLRSARVVNVYRYIRARIQRGGRSGNGLSASSPIVVPLSLQQLHDQFREPFLILMPRPIAANHISQSSRRWYGRNLRRSLAGSPGFPLNWYSRHCVSSPSVSHRCLQWRSHIARA